jgi:tetratricopeptide (TPR) repeat protein
MIPSAMSRLLRVIKDYWFLVTLAASLAASGTYMYVFHVTPWDSYRQIAVRRERVTLHRVIGQRLLESGHYDAAKTEFDRALSLDPLDDSAQWGDYLADLFIALPQPTWESAVWSAVRVPLSTFARGHEQQVGHVIEKYLGDVEQRLGNNMEAAAHYERALAMQPAYLDALYAYGWFYYSSQPDLSRMETLFRKMTIADRYDYRGFHGLGYALYMRALALKGATASALIKEAADQSARASSLRFQQLNVTMDFGEVARTVSPRLSLSYHEFALQLLDNPDTAKLPQVRDPLAARLLKRGSSVVVTIGSDSERRAWVQYQLALDHLALLRTSEVTQEGSPQEEREAYARLLKSARGLDGQDKVNPIYMDQLAILDQFLPQAP